ncbi:hypothetical protein OPLHCY645_23280 [Clostridium tetani]
MNVIVVAVSLFLAKYKDAKITKTKIITQAVALENFLLFIGWPPFLLVNNYTVKLYHMNYGFTTLLILKP